VHTRTLFIGKKSKLHFFSLTLKSPSHIKKTWTPVILQNFVYLRLLLITPQSEPREGKGKIVPMLFLNWAPRHEGVLRSGGIAPSILWPRHWMEESGQLHPQGKSPWYPLDMRLAGPQSSSWHGGEEENSQPSAGNRTPIVQLVGYHYTDRDITALIRISCCFVISLSRAKCILHTDMFIHSRLHNFLTTVCIIKYLQLNIIKIVNQLKQIIINWEFIKFYTDIYNQISETAKCPHCSDVDILDLCLV
jgi:hypothetical protein